MVKTAQKTETMARIARFVVPVQRGNRRERVFFCKDDCGHDRNLLSIHGRKDDLAVTPMPDPANCIGLLPDLGRALGLQARAGRREFC